MECSPGTTDPGGAGTNASAASTSLDQDCLNTQDTCSGQGVALFVAGAAVRARPSTSCRPLKSTANVPTSML